MDERLINKIIKVAYKDASVLERVEVYFAAKKDDEIKKLLADYKITAITVHKLEQEKCPDRVIDFIDQNVSEVKSDGKGFLNDLLTVIYMKPVVSTAGMAVVIFTIIFSLTIKDYKPVEAYSEKEIQIANEQVMESLAIVNNIFNKTGLVIKNEILSGRVSKPLNEGINKVNKLLGDDNENIN